MIPWLTEHPEQYNDWRWVWSSAWSNQSLIVFLFLFGISLYFAWHSSARLASLSQRMTLLVFRAILAVMFWILLAGPSMELRHIQKMQNHLPIFVDTSASMRTKSKKQGPSRIARIKAFFKKNETLIKRLKNEHKVRIYTFDRTVKRLHTPIQDIQANGDQTNLLTITKTIQETFSEKPLAGILLFTDGNDTLSIEDDRNSTMIKKERLVKKKKDQQRRLQHFVRELKKYQIPVHVVAPQKETSQKDIAITDIYGDTFAFLHNSASIEARIIAQGFEKTSIPVSLYREGELLDSKIIHIDPKQEQYSISFSFKPKQVGKYIYSIKIPTIKGEAVTENNEKVFVLKIIRDRIRVLQVVGQPSWDVRYLRRLLKKNANIDLISFFIMRTIYNNQPVPQREMALIPFPSKELFTNALKSFDLVIFQNFNFGPYDLRQYLPNIRKFVRNGGAFAMIGGNLSFGAGGYLGTAIEEILPIKLGVGRIDPRSFRPSLTSEGEHHPITRVFPDLVETKKLWTNLPNLQGSNRIGDAYKRSTVLLEHPFLKTNSGRNLPVLTVGEAEKGRVMSLSIDESWKWNFTHIGNGGTSTPYYRFWNNAIRWLIRDPELERIRVTTFRTSYRSGEKAQFRIKVLDRKYQPRNDGNVTISLFKIPEKKKLYSSQQAIQENGTVPFSWSPKKPGMYRIKVQSGEDSGSEIFEVRGLHDEFQKIHPNTTLFAEIQKETSGKQYDLNQTISDIPLKPPTVIKVDRSQNVDLWDNLFALITLFAFASIEWFLRRSWGLP